MKIYNRHSLNFFFILFNIFVIQCYSQDPIFSNSNQSIVALNPSFAGINCGIRYQSIYRNQWYNLSGGYSTVFNSFDAYIKPIKAGLSFGYMRDNQGDGTIISDDFGLSYAQQIHFLNGDLKIIPSIQITYKQINIDKSKLYFGSMIDPNRGFTWYNNQEIPSQRSAIILSSGLLINYKHLYLGASIFHLNQPDIGFWGKSKLLNRLSLYSSYNLIINDKHIIQPTVRFENQSNFTLLQLSLNNLLYNHFLIGASFQNGNAILINFGYRHNYFSISAGYDFVYSRLKYNTAGSYEIMATFNLRNKDKRKLITDFEKW
jgi:type IX secretion system PorP/SprF family membrane protein